MNLKTNNDLFLELRSSKKDLSDYKSLFNIIVHKLKLKNLSEEENVILKESLRKFCINLSKKWKECQRTFDVFLKRNQLWLSGNFVWPDNIFSTRSSSSAYAKCKDRLTQRKPFKELSKKQKRRRTDDLRKKNLDELSFAMSQKMSDENDDINKIMNFLNHNPSLAKKVRHFCENMEKYHCHSYSKEKALSLYTSLDLSKQQYTVLKKTAQEENCALYPTYYQIQQGKQDCYPSQNSILVTDTFATITLQSLLDHTIKIILDSMQCNVSGNLVLIGKCGFDGASGQSTYKQKFLTDNSENDDSSIFMTAYVPLKLCFSNDHSKIIWENPRPSSTFYCRPLNFQFIKESREVIQEAWQSLQDSINLLECTNVGNMSIKHVVLVTMIDGKICSTLAGVKSSMVCYICGAKPTDMNNLNKVVEKKPDTEHYKFGMSSLHAWIRMMECLIHVSYNIEFKKWSARSDEEKEMKKMRKLTIQQKFKKELGLTIDVVKQGVGTTNDGNTARRFFENSEKSAEITGLDLNLIKRFYTILQVLASNQRIDVEKFELYAKETAKLYINLYNWYYMPVSVHKILIHGAEIIKDALLPIGQLSEEAAEARNKHFRNYREERSRKCNRKYTNEDILHNLLISSDPVISRLRPSATTKKNRELSEDALSLLLL